MSETKLKVLLVDDESELVEIMSAFLDDHYIVMRAYSAEEALPLVSIHANELACIISDFQMKKMTGLAFRHEMLETYKDIPFILLSGRISRDDALAGIDARISAFESKPFDNSRLLDLVQRVARDREQSIRERIMLEQTFIEEASAICDELEPLIMSLETTPNDIENLNTIFRLVHTIKGSSGVLETTHVRMYVHKYEDLLSKLKKSQLIATPDIVSILLEGFDVVNRMIAHLRSGAVWEQDVEELAQIFDIGTKVEAKERASVESGFVSAAVPVRSNAKETVAVPTAMLDQFMEQSGEITVIRNMVNKLVRVIEKEQPGNRNIQQLGELLDEMHKINGGMQGRISETRKVPCSKVFRSLPRIVRDTAGALGKKVTLTIQGDETRIDTAIAKVLSDSMTHIVRNSLDHGIEMPDRRSAKGKLPEGRIQITAVEQKDEIIVTIADDGAGLNLDRIRKKAIERGLYKEEDLAGLPDKKIFGLIFESGFSTAEKITDVSGRGVGMDMVRSAVESLRGTIDIESTPDHGTKFHLHLPVPKSVLIINSLSVIAEELSFAVPQDRITRLIRFDGVRALDFVHELQGGFAIQFEGELIPVVDLAAVLNLRPHGTVRFQDRDSVNLLIINTANGFYALLVDGILDSEEIVVKSAGKHLLKMKVYLGATFMADGNVGLILNTDGIAEVARVGTQLQVSAETKESFAKDLARFVPATEYLVFRLFAEGKFAVPLRVVHRLEEIRGVSIQRSGQRLVAIYREQIVPLIDLSRAVATASAEEIDFHGQESVSIFVVSNEDHYIGFIIKSICDIAAVPQDKSYNMSDRPQISGTLDVSGEVVSAIDLNYVATSHKLSLTTNPINRDIKSGPAAIMEKPPMAAVSGERPAAHVVSKEEESQGWGLFD